MCQRVVGGHVFKFEMNVRMMRTRMNSLFLERMDRNIPSA